MTHDKWKVSILILIILAVCATIVILFNIFPNEDPYAKPPSLDVPITDFSDLMKEIPKEIIINNLTLEGNNSRNQFLKASIKNNGTKIIQFYSVHIGCFNETGNGVLQIHYSGRNLTQGSIENITTRVPPIPNHNITSVKVLSVDINDTIPTLPPMEGSQNPGIIQR